MATKQKVNKALEQLGASLTQDPGKYDFEEIEIVAPDGKVWASNLCAVLCFEFDRYSITKAELWDEVLTNIDEGLLDEDDS
jgi:uncharacterized protein YegL